MAIDVVVKVYATRVDGEMTKVGETPIAEVTPGWSGDWIDFKFPGSPKVYTFSRSDMEAAMKRCSDL